MILGPSFVARHEASYSSMVELDPEQVDRFWQRVEARSPRDGDEEP